jgi:hypothetical protein
MPAAKASGEERDTLNCVVLKKSLAPGCRVLVAPFEGRGYEKDGDTLFPNFDNETAIEVKIV